MINNCNTKQGVLIMTQDLKLFIDNNMYYKHIIVIHLMINGKITQKEAYLLTNHTKSTLSVFFQKMVKEGYFTKIPFKNTNIYKLSQEKGYILASCIEEFVCFNNNINNFRI
jgi:hypothetical protein